MLKKISLFFLLCFLVVSLSACGPKKEAGQEAKGTAEAFSGSVADLLKAGKNAKCVLTAKGDSAVISGTTYISGSKARSDYEMKGADGKAISGHYISDGTWMYTWNDVYKNQAMKFKIDQMAQMQDQGQTSAANTGDLQEKMDYQCSAWAPDQSKFSPPADINFQDYSQLLNQMQGAAAGTGAGSNNSLCAQCDKITDAASKAQCRKSLNCK